MYASEIPETKIDPNKTFSITSRLGKFTSPLVSSNIKITRPTTPAEKVISRIALWAETAQILSSCDSIARPSHPHPSPKIELDLKSVKETCQLIGASRWTIYRLIDGGSLKASKLGSRTIIARTEINNLFK